MEILQRHMCMEFKILKVWTFVEIIFSVCYDIKGSLDTKEGVTGLKRAILCVLLLALLFLSACGKSPEIDRSFDLMSVGGGSGDYFAQPSVGVQPAGFTEQKVGEASETRLYTFTRTESKEVFSEDQTTAIFVMNLQSTELHTDQTSGAVDSINAVLTQQHKRNLEMAEEDRHLAEAEYETVKTDSAENDFYAYSCYTKDTVTRLDSSILSLTTYFSSYQGGAHPDNYQIAMNFDTVTGKLLSLSDILTPDGEATLTDLILEQLASHGADYDLFSDYADSVRGTFSQDTLGAQMDNWYLQGQSLFLFFNPFEISPFASGIITVEIPDAVLREIMQPIYLSNLSFDAGWGTVRIGPADQLLSDDSQSISVEYSAGDGLLAVISEGTLYNVSMQYVQWAGEKTTASDTLLRMNVFLEGESFTVAYDSAEQLKHFCVSYDTGDGVERIIRISADADETVTYDFVK